MSARVVATVPLLLLFAANSHAQGFAPGMTIVMGEPRLRPAVPSDYLDPPRDRAKAVEARDRWAAGRRVTERDLAEKQRELKRLDQQANDIEPSVARTVEGAMKSTKELG